MDVNSIRPSAGTHDSSKPALVSTFTKFYDNPGNNVLNSAVSNLQNIGKADENNLLYFGDKGDIQTEKNTYIMRWTGSTESRDVRNLPFFFDKLKTALIHCDDRVQMVEIYEALQEAKDNLEVLDEHYETDPEKYKENRAAISSSLNTINSLSEMIGPIKANLKDTMKEMNNIVLCLFNIASKKLETASKELTQFTATFPSKLQTTENKDELMKEKELIQNKLREATKQIEFVNNEVAEFKQMATRVRLLNLS